ncbi:MAG: phosphotransferase [Nocardioides sp.]
MHDRSVLGPADVTDEQLARIAADSLGLDPGASRLLDSAAEEYPYELPALTTAGRYRVRGTVAENDTPRPFSVFVKHVQSWSRSPFFAFVPEDYRDMAEASVPWRTEPLAYRSDLGDRLPAGLAMPRALAVIDLDEKSAAVWLEEIDVEAVGWDLPRYAAAATLLGRLAASPRVAERADVGGHDFHIRNYYLGRLAMQVLPLLRDDDLWQHPLVAGAFDAELRCRLLRAADRAGDLVEELSGLPLATAHGDACPNNLLVRRGADGFVLIDYGFWGRLPIAFDLGQLLVGDVQIGRRSASELPAIEETIVPAYLAGLRLEGNGIEEPVVRRAHALHLLIFTGLSTLPFEHLDQAPTEDLATMARERAAIARFSLELVDATE